MKLKVQTLDAKAKGDIDLNDEVFGIEPRADILHRVVTWQREKARGTARPTRERSDVARTGKKFGRQKGGGVARHGDRRAPVFIGGGKAHGARLRDFNPSLNKKIRTLGLKMALSSKAKAGLADRPRRPRREGRQDQGIDRPDRQAWLSARPLWSLTVKA
jgi:large subunit ribosomal protein L4